MGKTTWDAVEKLAREWYETPKEGNEALYSQLEQKIFMGLFDLYGANQGNGQAPLDSQVNDKISGIIEFFSKDWRKFNPNLSSLKTYTYRRIKEREQDARREDQNLRRVMRTDTFANGEVEKKETWIRNESLDAQSNDDFDDDGKWEDRREDPRASEVFALIGVEESAVSALALILALPEKLNGKANNPVRHNYFRMFFTDAVSNILHGAGTVQCFDGHQRDLFTAMKLPFLDYFLVDSCRTTAEIAATPLKLYSELVEGRPPERTKHPLANDVYTSYLTREEQYPANASAITQQRKAYQAFLRENLC